MKKFTSIISTLWLMILCFLPMQAFSSDDNSTFSQAELDQMLAPIALYPDSLLSQILMASTYPANVAEAVKWSKSNPKQEGDAAVKAVQNESWDPSVMSLVAFPQVLDMMGEKPDWVQNVGDAFLANPETVMSSIQNLRRKAKEEGNLKTTQEQTVTIEQASSPEIIVIEPAEPTVIYVPTYNPTIVYGTWWYPSYPPYYYNPVGSAIVAGISFGIGVGIVNSLWGGCNWRRGDVDIDVNRYNNINSSRNKINASNRKTNWKHNNNNRRSPYRDRTSQKKFNNKLGGADKRKDFRGRDTNKDFGSRNTRDAERKRAQSSLKNHGVDPAAARKTLSGTGGDKIRSQVNNIDRNRGNNFNSGSLGNNRQTRDRAKASNLSQNRSKNFSQNRSKNNSLSGISNQSRSSSNFNRGSRSRSSFGGGGRSRGGGRRGGRR